MKVVRVLLAHGADTSQPALEIAVRHGQFAIISLLLDHGAEIGEATTEAVAKGYRTVVCTLLKYDTNAKLKLQDLLVRAVELEDEELFRLLVEYAGGVVDVATRAACAKIATERGSESIL